MQNWEIKTLQEVCIMKITDGTHQTPKYCEKEDGGYPFISSKNVTKEYIDWSDIKYIIPELHETLYKRIAPQKNDVLLAKNGTTGVAAIVDDDRIFDVYVTLAVLRPNTKIIYPQYLLKIINSPICKVQFNAHLKGSGVPNLHLEEIQKVTIPLPPLEEQKRIVKILDKKFAMLETVKANAKNNLQNAKDLLFAELTKTFEQESWKTMSLQDVCTRKITDGTHQTPKYCTKEEGGYPFISSKDVTKEFIDWTNIKYIIPELHEELYKRIAPQKDDILLAKNGTTGVAAIVEDDKVFDIYVTLAVLRPNKDIINPRYLLAIVNSPLCKEQFNAHLKGSGVPNLHLEEIQKVLIPIPPLAEQKIVVKNIEELKTKVRSLEEIYTKQLANCDELKQAFLAKAFAGEL